MNTVTDLAGAANPTGNGFSESVTPLTTELQARRHLALAMNRMWAVTKPEVHNALGQPTSYQLMPGANSVPSPRGPRPCASAPASSMCTSGSRPTRPTRCTPRATIRTRARAVTVSRGGRVRIARIVDRDVVLWYTMGRTHVRRPEDWPMMAVQRVGFRLVPDGFFTHDPALDLPKQPALAAAAPQSKP